MLRGHAKLRFLTSHPIPCRVVCVYKCVRERERESIIACKALSVQTNGDRDAYDAYFFSKI